MVYKSVGAVKLKVFNKIEMFINYYNFSINKMNAEKPDGKAGVNNTYYFTTYASLVTILACAVSIFADSVSTYTNLNRIRMYRMIEESQPFVEPSRLELQCHHLPSNPVKITIKGK